MSARAFAAVLVLALLAGCGRGERAASGLQGDPERGRAALAQHACRACHMIPGVTGPETWVGPPLEQFGQRKFIAGRIPNTHPNLVRWIRNPQSVDPNTAMPAMGVSERDAVDMSAWLLRPGN